MPFFRPVSQEFLKNNFLSWRFGNVGTSVRDMAVFNGELYVGGLGGVVYVFDDKFNVIRSINLAGNDIEKIIVNNSAIFIATIGANRIFRSFDGVNFNIVHTHGGTIRSGACNNSDIIFIRAATSNNMVYSTDNGDNWTTVTLDANNSLYWNSTIHVPQTNQFIVSRGFGGYKVGSTPAEIIANPIIPYPPILAGSEIKSWGYDGERYFAGTNFGTVFNTTTPTINTSWAQNITYLRAVLQAEIDDFVQTDSRVVYGIDSLGNVFKIIDNVVEILPHSGIYQGLSMTVFNGEVIFGDLSQGFLHKTLKGND